MYYKNKRMRISFVIMVFCMFITILLLLIFKLIIHYYISNKYNKEYIKNNK